MAVILNASTSSGLVTTADNSGQISLQTNGTTAVQIDTSSNLQFNSGYGSVATAYGCRAWVMFDSSSGTPTIRASGNVSSITDNGSGDFTVNMTNAMPDTYYAITGFTRNNLGSPNGLFSFGSTSTSTKTTSACRVQNTYWNGAYGITDTSETCVAIFR